MQDGDGGGGGGGGGGGSGAAAARQSGVAEKRTYDKEARKAAGGRRRVAIKKTKLVIQRGHQLAPRYFKKPTYCGHCRKFLSGFRTPGFRCTQCQFSCHQKCGPNINFTCVGADDFDRTESKFAKNPHKFKCNTYFQPTFCDHCGGMLYGIARQGHKCGGCKMNLHKRCIALAGEHCGTDHTERRGRMQLSVAVEPLAKGGGLGTAFRTEYELVIRAGQASGLLAMDTNGYSDPYLQVYIGPNKPKNEKGGLRKCKPRFKTLECDFAEEFRLVVSLADMRANGGSDKRLIIELWDKDKITADDFMGAMSFGLEELKAVHDQHQLAKPGSVEPCLSGLFKWLDKKAGATRSELIPPDPSVQSSRVLSDFEKTTLEGDDSFDEPERKVVRSRFDSLPVSSPLVFLAVSHLGARARSLSSLSLPSPPLPSPSSFLSAGALFSFLSTHLCFSF
jgi:hypothetical protein